MMLLLVIPLAAAEEGCFVYPGSSFYCTDVTPEKAAQECSFYDNCVLPEAYFEEASCADAESFSQCRKISCKSSCKEEFSGKCVGGKIPDGKEAEWCSPGCCQFPYFGGSFCGHEENKWKCETQAKNKEVVQYLFVFPMDEFTCAQQCGSGQLSVEKFLPENVTETILPFLPSYPPAAEDQPSASPLFLQWALFFTFLAGSAYLIHAWWRWSKRTQLHLPPESGEEKKPSRARLNIFNIKSFQFQRLRLTRQHGLRHHPPAKISGVQEPKVKEEDVFSRLREAASRRKPAKKENVFENLEHLAEFTKNREKITAKKSEAEKALQKLREMAGKK